MDESLVKESRKHHRAQLEHESALSAGLQQYMRFVISGALAIAAYLALFEVFRLFLDLPIWAASVGAYVLATILNYLLNYHWSFAAHGPHNRTLAKYAFIALVSVSLNGFIVPLLVNFGLPPTLSAFAFAITWPIVSFFAQKHWAFKSA
ncbi:MAG: GtrA family protein [Pseudomonadota bacterium]